MENSLKYLLSAFLLIMLGAVFVSIYADQNNSINDLKSVTETYTLNYAGDNINQTYYFYPAYLAYANSWRADAGSCSVTSLVVKNTSGDTLTNNGCATGGDYVYTEDTQLNFCDNTNINSTATATATYNYCADDYIASSWGRSIGNIAVGLFALLVLGGIVGLLFKAYKELGIK